MGLMILGALCTAAEVFLIYFLVQLFRDSRRESRAAADRTQSAAKTQRFVQFELSPPAAKAVWNEGRWQMDESCDPVVLALTERIY